MLGLGAKTITRIENGDIQSRSTDKAIRLLMLLTDITPIPEEANPEATIYGELMPYTLHVPFSHMRGNVVYQWASDDGSREKKKAKKPKRIKAFA